ncbi:hypothetical protein [Spiroplasma endosymbiont of Agriotes lineatus]|uniref:hypothetical protein n=1 Tax=Spiroplasma endosymbiont of Agriotes lineatus TaxID=3077930 RepID=UPI0030D6005A
MEKWTKKQELEIENDKLKIKNSFKKQWLKVVLSIIFIFTSLLLCALTVIDTKWITGTSNEFNDFMNEEMVKFFGKFNSGIMLAGIFVFWWGGVIYFAIKFEKLIRLIIQKIKAKRALKNEIKQTH